MKLDASLAPKGITFRRPRVILKTRQFIGLSVCLWIQERTAWNSQVTLNHWSFSEDPKYHYDASLCNNSSVENKILAASLWWVLNSQWVCRLWTIRPAQPQWTFKVILIPLLNFSSCSPPNSMVWADRSSSLHLHSHHLLLFVSVFSLLALLRPNLISLAALPTHTPHQSHSR